jgi:CHAT domain-containing protein/lipoprotein NlpI
MRENNVTGQSPERNDHLSAHSVAAYLNDQLADSERLKIEEHCQWCAECREQMALVALALRPEPAMDQEREFAELLRMGEQTANRVRREQLAARAERRFEPWQWLAGLRPALRFALAALLLIALALPGWLLWRSNQPLERAMASLRQAWTINRPLEARVTGGFPYLPYQVTRSGAGTIPVNQDQLLAATAELAREVADKPSAQARHALGRLHLLKAEYAKAEEQLNAAVRADPNNAQAYVDLAAAMYERGTLEQSVMTLSQAAENCEKAVKLAPRLPEAWFNLALIHEQMMLLSKAKTDWEKYLELDSTSRWADEARARLQKLRERSAIQEPDLKKIADELLAADQTDNEAELVRLLAENFSEVTTLLSNRFLDEYLAARADRDQAGTERSQRLLHRVAQRLKETKGEHYFADLVDYVSRADEVRVGKVREIQAWLKQADTSHRQGQDDQAIPLYEKARMQAEQIEDFCHAEAALYGMALALNSQQVETPEMPALRQRLLTETSERRHRLLHARALWAARNLHLAGHRFSEALKASSKAYEIFSELGDLIMTINSLRSIGVIQSILGDHEAGIRSAFAALQPLWKQPSSAITKCTNYTSVAETLGVGGYEQAALDYQIEALDYCKACGNEMMAASSYERTGALHLRTGRNEEALRLLNEAVSRAENYRDKTGTAILLPDFYLNLGNALVRVGQAEKAEPAYRKALNALGSHQFRNQSALHHGLAIACLKQGKESEAERELAESIRLIEQARQRFDSVPMRRGFLSDRQNVYRTMADFQYTVRKSFDRAFGYAELYRKNELLEALAGSAGNRPDRAEMLMRYSDTLPLLTVKEVQKALPSQTQLLEYAVTETHLLIWLIRADYWMTTHVSISAEKLREMVADYLKALSSRNDSDALAAKAAGLYRALIEPVAGEMFRAGNLVIVPDSFLHALPFSALVAPDSNQYLSQKYAVVVNPSAAVTIRMSALGRAKKKRNNEALLTLSNPRFDLLTNPDLKPLPRTEVETDAIRVFYPASADLRHSAATRRNLLGRIGNYDIVHLATHSLVNAREPLSSSILLASESAPEMPAGEPVGGLTAQDIFRLRLDRTRLVILSSCRSGVNPLATDSGSGGLAHSFFSAGVPTVVASLWEVDDESTTELMKEFHRSYRLEGKSFSQALQQAQLKMMNSASEQWRHPYYWAAILISGDGIGS